MAVLGLWVLATFVVTRSDHNDDVVADKGRRGGGHGNERRGADCMSERRYNIANGNAR